MSEEKKSNVKVSVVIPVYNTPPAYLRECLDSVVGQTLKELQIICVDDCSTDGSLEILKEYAQKEGRMNLVLHSENRGISESRNTGASHVVGEYLYFMDCDDFLDLDALERLYQVATEKKVDTLLFQCELFYETPEMKETYSRQALQVRYGDSISQVKTGIEWFVTLEKDCKYNTPVWLQLIRTAHYKEHQLGFHPMVSHVGEDWLFTMGNFLVAQRVAGLGENFYHYRLREQSGSTKKRELDYIAWYLNMYTLMLLTIKEKSISPENMVYFHHYLDMLAFTCGKNYYEITGEEPTLVEEALLNTKHMMFQQPLKKLCTWEIFFQKKAKPLVFFGAGLESKKALALFQSHHATLPVAICDNDRKKQGTTVKGIPVLSLEEALTQYKDCVFLITNRRFYWAIYAQMEEVIGEERILKLSF